MFTIACMSLLPWWTIQTHKNGEIVRGQQKWKGSSKLVGGNFLENGRRVIESGRGSKHGKNHRNVTKMCTKLQKCEIKKW